MTQTNRIRINAAVAHFGRPGDGYGGKAKLAETLGISQAAISRWSGPYLPARHAKTLLQKRRLRYLAER